MLKELKKTFLALLKKPYAVTLLSVCAGAALLLIAFKIFIVIRIPEKQLKSSIEAFFKENFNKAVDFEDVSLSMAGKAVISNLNVSISSDFNDNISLIKSEKAVIKFDFTGLLGGEYRVRGLVFKGAEISLPKKYGQGYSEFIKEMFRSGRALTKLRYVDLGDFSARISGGRLHYLEGFRDSKLDLECYRMSADVVFSGDGIHYEFSGRISPARSTRTSPGSFHGDGRLYLNKEGSVARSSGTVEIEGFDLSYMNLPFLEYCEMPWTVFGRFSSSIRIDSLGDAISMEASVNLDNLSVEKSCGKGIMRIVSNENIAARFSIDMLSDLKRIVVRRLELRDDSTGLSLRGVRTRNAHEHSLDAVFRLEASNLGNTASVFSPFKQMAYEGRLDAEGRCSYDFLNNRAREVSLRAELRDFSLRRTGRGADPYFIRDMRARLCIQDGRCDLDFHAGHGDSDVSLRWTGFIRHWSPFTSRSRLAVDAKRLEAETIGALLVRCLDGLVGSAIEDKGRGYEDIFFKQKPLGIFVSNNSLDLRLSAGTILFNKRKGLQNLLLEASLADGILRTNEFRLSGYGGDYSCELSAYLNCDHPNFKIGGRFTRIGLESLCRDYRVRGVDGGTLDIEFEYEGNGYRPAHLLDNGKMKLDISINGAGLRGTRLQGEIKNFLKMNGYDNLSLDEVILDQARLSLGLLGGFFTVSQLSLSGNTFNVNGYGSYSRAEGLRIPLTASLTAPVGEGEPSRTSTVPLLIDGSLLRPSLSIQGKKDSKPLLLFNIN